MRKGGWTYLEDIVEDGIDPVLFLYDRSLFPFFFFFSLSLLFFARRLFLLLLLLVFRMTDLVQSSDLGHEGSVNVENIFRSKVFGTIFLECCQSITNTARGVRVVGEGSR